jgi:hypothetical protein
LSPNATDRPESLRSYIANQLSSQREEFSLAERQDAAADNDQEAATPFKLQKHAGPEEDRKNLLEYVLQGHGEIQGPESTPFDRGHSVPHFRRGPEVETKKQLAQLQDEMKKMQSTKEKQEIALATTAHQLDQEHNHCQELEQQLHQLMKDKANALDLTKRNRDDLATAKTLMQTVHLVLMHRRFRKPRGTFRRGFACRARASRGS